MTVALKPLPNLKTRGTDLVLFHEVDTPNPQVFIPVPRASQQFAELLSKRVGRDVLVDVADLPVGAREHINREFVTKFAEQQADSGQASVDRARLLTRLGEFGLDVKLMEGASDSVLAEVVRALESQSKGVGSADGQFAEPTRSVGDLYDRVGVQLPHSPANSDEREAAIVERYWGDNETAFNDRRMSRERFVESFRSARRATPGLTADEWLKPEPRR